MITRILFSVFALSLVACNTSFRSQTPDDVYYSPAKVIEEDDRYEEKNETVSDGEERRMVMSRYDRRWRRLDYDYDYDYRYDPYRSCYGYSTNYKYGYSYNYCNGYYYNPFYSTYPVYYPGVRIINPTNNTVRSTPLGGYTTPVVIGNNPKTGSPVRVSRERAYNTTNRTSTRRVFSNSDQNSSPSNNRTYSPSSNNSSSPSKGTTITRPSRGN